MNKYLIIILFVVKTILLISFGDFSKMNPDEETNYKIAYNFIEGNGYTNNNGRLTAFHGSFTVFLYQKIIQAKISKKSYIIFYHCFALILFLVSVPFFYNILLQLKIPPKFALLSTIIYSFYPSNIYYIGNFFWYEKLTLPLLVIGFYSLFMTFKENNKNISFLFLPVIVTISCLLRAHLVPIYFITILLFMIYALVFRHEQKFIKRKISILSLTVLLMILTHGSILKKNKEMFGEYILSTQAGYELMQGHNDLAGGRWYADCYREDSPYTIYSKNNIQNIAALNEYEEGVARKQFALHWIKNNPKKECILILRKTAIFFLPKNFSSGYHPVNIIVHFCFFLGFLLMIYNKRINFISIFLLSPILVVFILSQIYFVGLRWRYYAEPFFILFAMYQFWEYVKTRKKALIINK